MGSSGRAPALKCRLSSACVNTVTYIRDGFTFLGQTFRKHDDTLHITPAKEGVLALIRKVGTLIRKYTTAPIGILIKKLNEVLRGWANYHRHVVASKAFARVDKYVYEQLWRLLRRRHSKRSKKWLFKKYWTASGKKGVFARIIRYKKKLKLYQVIKVGSIAIRRHRKIIAKANPYSPEYVGYYCRRKRDKESKLLRELTARQMRLAL